MKIDLIALFLCKCHLFKWLQLSGACEKFTVTVEYFEEGQTVLN